MKTKILSLALTIFFSLCLHAQVEENNGVITIDTNELNQQMNAQIDEFNQQLSDLQRQIEDSNITENIANQMQMEYVALAKGMKQLNEEYTQKADKMTKEMKCEYKKTMKQLSRKMKALNKDLKRVERDLR